MQKKLREIKERKGKKWKAVNFIFLWLKLERGN